MPTRAPSPNALYAHPSQIKSSYSLHHVRESRAFVAASAGRPLAQAEAPSEDGPSPSGRKILFAVDGTDDAEEALRWVIKQVARKGDTIHLAHVICDPRTPSTAVGSSTAAMQWTPARDEQVYAREFFLRKEHEAGAMLGNRFVPSLQFTGVNHEVDLLRLRLHKSAAGIGEALAKRAVDVRADLMVIASHGAGVLADYGSVARWCCENSRVPVLLIPPASLRSSAAAPSNTVIVAAVDTPGLRRAFDFALAQLTRRGDSLYVMLAKGGGDSEAEAVAARKALVAAVLRWQEESAEGHARSLNVAVDLIQEACAGRGSESDSGSGSAGEAAASHASAAGQRLCDYAADLNARAVVLHHHGKSMMREMMFGPVTTQCTKFCCRPLLVLGAGDAPEGFRV